MHTFVYEIFVKYLLYLNDKVAQVNHMLISPRTLPDVRQPKVEFLQQPDCPGSRYQNRKRDQTNNKARKQCL